ncbi:MAG TPA: hypothetical protein VNJ71_00360 [Gemmatimonadales bacterium]|nr:hypothetical protein [Gemmatimonadales bacterium]
MIQGRSAALLVLLAACGGGRTAPPPTVAPAASPEEAVRRFMAAVADSNIPLMGRHWGTARGPASVTGQPADYQRRLTVTQLYLRNTPYKIVRIEAEGGNPTRQVVTVELDRRECVRAVPFTTVKTADGAWIVAAIDLNLAGTPGRPCAAPKPDAQP